MKHTSVIILVESLYRRSLISLQCFGYYNWWTRFHWSDFILLWFYFWSNSAHPWQYKRSTTTTANMLLTGAWKSSIWTGTWERKKEWWSTTHIIRVERSTDTSHNQVLATFFIVTNAHRNIVTHKPECSIADKQSAGTIHYLLHYS